MIDPKNIVIKVKYTTPVAAVDPSASNAKMITEWNIKRIAGAVSALILLITALCLLLADNSEPEVAAQNEAVLAPTPSASQSAVQLNPKFSSPETPVTPEKQAALPNPASPPAPAVPTHSKPSAPIGSSGRIRRAALAYRIVDKEPADLIEGNVNIGNGKSVQVYYFTEVRGKTAQILFHEWLRNGQMVLRHPIAVAAERWRTSSQRELGPNDRGNWSVRTIDKHGTVMNEIRFTVSAE